MELPVSSWKKTLEALGIRIARNRRIEKRILPQATRLHTELLEARWTPSTSVGMAWVDGTSIEGQFQATTLRLSQPAINPVTVTLVVNRESTADNSDSWRSKSKEH